MNFDDFAIGVDIEEIERFRGKEKNFYERIFSSEEIEYCEQQSCPEQHYAARFCAKEAVFKALSVFDERGMEFKKIEVYHKNRVPYLRFLSELNDKYQAKVSLSHDKTKAIAYVIISKLDNERDIK